MKKILVPTDFSKPSQTAIKYAEGIARKAKAELVLLHIVELSAGSSFNVEGEAKVGGNMFDKLFAMKLIEKESKMLAQLADGLRAKGINVSTELRLGDPYHGIQTVVTDCHADLIIMGTTGKTGLEEVVAGSNTQKVIRNSKCPVLTVHEKNGKVECKNIVYATSMRKGEEVFSRIIRTTQGIFNATVHLVHINMLAVFIADSVIRPYLEKFARNLMLQNFTINIYNDYTTEDGVQNFAASINADLIAMATHQRGALSHLLFGNSIAAGIAKQASLPVLTMVVK